MSPGTNYQPPLIVKERPKKLWQLPDLFRVRRESSSSEGSLEQGFHDEEEEETNVTAKDLDFSDNYERKLSESSSNSKADGGARSKVLILTRICHSSSNTMGLQQPAVKEVIFNGICRKKKKDLSNP